MVWDNQPLAIRSIPQCLGLAHLPTSHVSLAVNACTIRPDMTKRRIPCQSHLPRSRWRRMRNEQECLEWIRSVLWDNGITTEVKSVSHGWESIRGGENTVIDV